MTQSSQVYSILQRNLSSYMLQGYSAGIFDEGGERLYGYTFVDIDPADYEKNENVYNLKGGFTGYGIDDEKTRIYLDGGTSFQTKDVKQSVREGIYKAFSLCFFGYFFENRWYIKKSLKYFGEFISKEQAITILSDGIDDGSIFEISSYQPLEPFFEDIVIDEAPLSIGVEYNEFLGQPELVAYIKQEKKLELLRAHSQFIYLDVFSPFLDKLKVDRFAEFSGFFPTYPLTSSFIFSTSREFVLLPIFIKNSKNEYRRYYFFWNTSEKVMYQWVYFASPVYDDNYVFVEDLIEDLSKITYWNDYGYFNSSCTLDDDNFWQNYVLVKENGKYRYLSAFDI